MPVMCLGLFKTLGLLFKLSPLFRNIDQRKTHPTRYRCQSAHNAANLEIDELKGVAATKHHERSPNAEHVKKQRFLRKRGRDYRFPAQFLEPRWRRQARQGKCGGYWSSRRHLLKVTQICLTRRITRPTQKAKLYQYVHIEANYLRIRIKRYARTCIAFHRA